MPWRCLTGSCAVGACSTRGSELDAWVMRPTRHVNAPRFGRGRAGLRGTRVPSQRTLQVDRATTPSSRTRVDGGGSLSSHPPRPTPRPSAHNGPGQTLPRAHDLPVTWSRDPSGTRSALINNQSQPSRRDLPRHLVLRRARRFHVHKPGEFMSPSRTELSAYPDLLVSTGTVTVPVWTDHRNQSLRYVLLTDPGPSHVMGRAAVHPGSH